uniref:Uncharacterized protein n=1 Tax=Hyaloperonospora arabidopsidis (strain Emoy2) TaxID=559515 RepID=M4BQ55_HYAAE
MSFTSSASDSSWSETPSPTFSSTADSHAVGLLAIDRSNPSFPPIASLVSSASRTVSPITRSHEAAKTNVSAALSNATNPRDHAGKNGGRWTEQEHQNFLAGLRLYGREWKKVAAKIKTRTSAQIRSHAQKYFAKIARDKESHVPNGLFTTMAGPVDYFSDGGSSFAQNSGDDDAHISDAARQTARMHSATGIADESAAYFTASTGSDAARPYKQPAGTLKKRSRPLLASIGDQEGMKPRSLSNPHKLYKHKNDATQVEGLPSQEELLAKVSPKLRHRLSSLIESELSPIAVHDIAVLRIKEQL